MGAFNPTLRPIWDEEFSTLGFKHVVRLFVWFEILFGSVARFVLLGVISGWANRSED